MKGITACLTTAVVCAGVFGVKLFHCADAGKTLKLPHYDITFGSWPLMAVTRRGRGQPRHIGGGGAPNKIIGGGGGPNKFRGYGNYGPPPTPGKFVLLRPGANKGTIHKHLQDTLKHYANNKKPVNLKLPIIVKAPGPNPPPPPPGYKLGPPNSGPLPGGAGGTWQPGPVFPGAEPSKGPKNSRLFSMLKNVAFSGIFNSPVDTYIGPGYSPGPPMSATFVSVDPDGTEVRTHVNGDFVTEVRDNNDPHASGIEVKPSIPPVLRLGEPLPENYTVMYAERQVVGLKSPDLFEKSGVETPGKTTYDAAFNLGTKYEQGHGPKPPPTRPLLITKFQKRGDIEPVKKLIEQELPDTGLMVATHLVFSSPNISAPLNGKNSPHFKAALEDKQRILKTRRKEKPLDAQVKLLGRLFTKLQRLKPPKIAVPEHEEDDGYDPHKEPGGWNRDEEDDGWKKVAKTKVDSPVMAVQIQSLSAADIDSSDPDIVESMAEFGNHDIEFGETDEIVNLMQTVMRDGSSRVNIRDLGSNPQEINENMLDWARRHLAMARIVNDQGHGRMEKIANHQFKQYQTFVTPPFGTNGWGPAEPMPVDPKLGRRAFANSMTVMTANMQRSADQPPQI